MLTVKEQFLSAQRAYMAALQGEGGLKTEARKAWATEHDKDNHAELNTMRAQPCNAECFDCTARKPGWAVLPHGVFVCIDCAQIHRNLGRHVSQTKAINTGTYLWFEPEMALMRVAGNGVAARLLAGAPTKPSRDATAATKAAYARAKYEEKRWGPLVDDATALPDIEGASTPPTSLATPSPAEAMRMKHAPPKTRRALNATRVATASGPASTTAAHCTPSVASTAISVPLSDLISLEEPMPAATPHGGAPEESWADFGSFPLAAPASPALPPHQATLDLYEDKKDKILSLFGKAANHAAQPQPLAMCNFRCAPIPSPAPPANYDSGKFFASYGL